MMKKTCALLPLAVAACSTPTLTSVDLKAENNPPLMVTVTGTGITIPAGIGVAFVATLHLDNKTTDDTADVSVQGTACDVSDGIDKNEFFLVCNEAGSATLVVTDGADPDKGEVRVPITATLQPGSVSLPDGGFPVPPQPDGGAAPDAPAASEAGMDGAGD